MATTTTAPLPAATSPADGTVSAPETTGMSTASLPSPTIAVDHHPGDERMSLTASASEPTIPTTSAFQSPLRHHRRTPSVHREVKETLDARTEYASNDDDGRVHHRINQYIIKDEIGRGSYGAVHLATDQFGTEYAVKEFSKTRLRKRAQSNVLRQGPRRLGPRFPPPRGSGPGPTPAGSGSLNAPLSPHFSPFGPDDGGPASRPGSRSRPSSSAGEAEDSLFHIREEVAIMKKLNHPNLVQLIEVLDDPEEDSLYMVLEMCKKGVVMKVGLDDKASAYAEETCRFWFRDLILGIEYLHTQGVIHRDIKPDNLLLSDKDELKIVDFGVSEMFEKPDEMMTAKSAGSPAFLPPELCVAKHGDVSGKAADIWSMGVSLYCLRYGKIPFERSSVFEMFHAIKHEEPQLPDGENPDFVDLMARILEKDPQKRIQMPELREHVWVTKGGVDRLLSKEQNCAHPVEPPNALELNRAFTRKMNHLLCVMKAIQKFKAALARRAAKRGEARKFDLPPSSDGRPFNPAEEKARAEDVEALVQQRRKLIKARESTDPGRFVISAKDHDASEGEPLFLGIGAGSRDPFATEEATPDQAVSDSPTAVDFNVYDRAYEAEVQRIMSHGPSRQTTMYLTRFVKDRDQYRENENMVEGTSAPVSAVGTPTVDTPPPLRAQQPSSSGVGLDGVSQAAASPQPQLQPQPQAKIASLLGGRFADVVNSAMGR